MHRKNRACLPLIGYNNRGQKVKLKSTKTDNWFNNKLDRLIFFKADCFSTKPVHPWSYWMGTYYEGRVYKNITLQTILLNYFF